MTVLPFLLSFVLATAWDVGREPPPPWYTAARESEQQGDYVGALTIAKRQIATAPTDVFALYYRGALLTNRFKRHAGAVTAFEGVRALMPHFPEIEVNLAHALRNLGTTLAQARRPAQAVAAFERSAQLDPEQVDTFARWGSILMTELYRHEEAIVCLRRALALEMSGQPRQTITETHASIASDLAVALLRRYPTAAHGTPEGDRVLGELRSLPLEIVWPAVVKLDLAAPGATAETRAAAAAKLEMFSAAGEIADNDGNAIALASSWFRVASSCGALGRHLDDKRLLHRALTHAGAARLAPRSFDLSNATEKAAALREVGSSGGSSGGGASWLLRMPTGADGQGTYVLGAEGAPSLETFDGIVSEYIRQPLKIGGRKSEMRVYVLVERASAEGDMRVHLYERWFWVRVAKAETAGVFTNVATGHGTEVMDEALVLAAAGAAGVGREESDDELSVDEDEPAEEDAAAWWRQEMWPQIEDLVRTAVSAAASAAFRDGQGNPCALSVLSFDVMLSVSEELPHTLRPYLIEVNERSSYHSDTSLHAKASGLARDLIAWLRHRALASPPLSTQGPSPVPSPMHHGFRQLLPEQGVRPVRNEL